MCSVNDILFLLVALSKNEKTGLMSQIYASKNTCPNSSCPFKNAGCYAKGYTISKHWSECKLTLEDLRKRVKELPLTNIIRYGVAGDLCIENTNDINLKLVLELMDIFKNRTLFGYTHTDIFNSINSDIVKLCNNENFKLNVSCESLDKVKYCKDNNLPCVMAVQEMDENIKRVNDILFVKCPNQVIKEKNTELKKQGKELLPIVNCSNCKACVNTSRQAVIVFVNHGNLKKRNTFLINL